MAAIDTGWTTDACQVRFSIKKPLLVWLCSAPAGFAEPLQVGRISETAPACWNVLGSARSSVAFQPGPFVRELEERLASCLGVRHAIATASGVGAVVIRDLEPRGMYVGAPARKIRDRRRDVILEFENTLAAAENLSRRFRTAAALDEFAGPAR